MENIFAPWRMAYIQVSKNKDGCIFCDFPPEYRDEERLILHRGATCFVIFNAFPYNPGHLMVAPYRHTAEYELLSDEEMLEMHRLGGRCISVLKKVMNPQGFNIGINLGKVAGAGFDGHLHLHIVPRWNGDTNFMPVFADVRVVAEELAETYARMKEAWNE
ncbi:HIT domain-containing protein [Aminivibrio sp.]|uniref:HIT family protein n=1 Tax=Aminivibrio sp. TaxID=1872489 RepID=UPI001A50696C|nr:HIT domain-containing protein [Aminivibrio sp.]MBL3538693.1 HIT domain-containing protein [Aminivibrio sp.]